jgi:hypothetical protein
VPDSGGPRRSVWTASERDGADGLVGQGGWGGGDRREGVVTCGKKFERACVFAARADGKSTIVDFAMQPALSRILRSFF